MKKLLIALLTLSLALSLAACGNTGTTPSDSTPSGTAPAESAPPASAPANSPAADKTDASLDYPNGTIKILVPFSAGGGTDLLARAVAPELSERLGGASVIVENKPGGSGAIGMSELQNAKPDGLTLAITSAGPTTLTPNNSDVGYTNKEFAPICQISSLPIAFFVRTDSGIENMEQLLAKAQENPGAMTFATSGAGLIQHITVEMFLKEIGSQGLFTHVPFDGGVEAITALVGGQVDFCVGDAADAASFMSEGNLLCIAVTSEETDPSFPDSPTMKELGYDLVSASWWGFAAPAGTPDEIIDLLDATIKDCLEDPELVEIFGNLQQPVDYKDREAFTNMWMTNFDLFKEIIAGLQ